MRITLPLLIGVGLVSSHFPAQENPSQQIRQQIEKLRSESVEEREQATRNLKAWGEAAAPDLEKAAQDKDAEIAGRARHLLQILSIAKQLTPGCKKAMAGIAERLVGDDARWTEVLLDMTSLDENRKRKVPFLLREDLEPLAARALRGARTSEEIERVCASICQRQLRSALPEMTRLLKDENEEVRKVAVEALGKGLFSEAAPAIVGVLKDKASTVQVSAIEALERLHYSAAAPEIFTLLKEEGTFVRGKAVGALGLLGYRKAIPEIAGLLKDRDFDVRSAAVLSLGQLGAKTMAPELALLLKKKETPLSPEDTFVRSSAVTALGRLGYREAIPDIIALLGEKDPWSRSYAMQTLWLLDAKEAAPKVVPLIAERDAMVGLYARWALERWDARALIPDIETLLGHKEPFVRARAIEALASMGAKESIPRIAGFLTVQEPYMRGVAAQALCLLGSREGIPVLLETDMPSASGLFRLNLIRQPGVWKDLRQKRLQKDLEGWGVHLEEQLRQECGMPLEISVQAREVLGNWEWFRGISCEEGRQTLIDSIEEQCWTGCEYILEPDRIRVVSREEADAFWRDWWRTEQEKK